MSKSIFDWEMYFKRHKYFPSKSVKTTRGPTDYNAKLGLSQKTVASVIASWKEHNLGF